MDVGYVLRQFGKGGRAARKAYHRFIGEGMGMGEIPELTGGGLIRSKGGWSQVLSARRRGDGERGDERILGDGDFVRRILKEDCRWPRLYVLREWEHRALHGRLPVWTKRGEYRDNTI